MALGSEDISNCSGSPISGRVDKDTVRKGSNDICPIDEFKLIPTSPKQVDPRKKETAVGLSSENSSEPHSNRHMILQKRKSDNNNLKVRLGDKERLQRRKILRKPSSFSQVEYLEATKILKQRGEVETLESCNSSEENTTMMPKLSEKSGMLSTFCKKNSESRRKLSGHDTVKMKPLQWHERLFK